MTPEGDNHPEVALTYIHTHSHSLTRSPALLCPALPCSPVLRIVVLDLNSQRRAMRFMHSCMLAFRTVRRSQCCSFDCSQKRDRIVRGSRRLVESLRPLAFQKIPSSSGTFHVPVISSESLRFLVLRTTTTLVHLQSELPECSCLTPVSSCLLRSTTWVARIGQFCGL